MFVRVTRAGEQGVNDGCDNAHGQRQVADGEYRSHDSAAVRPARWPGIEWSAIRLRAVAVRRMHGHPERRGGAFLRAAGGSGAQGKSITTLEGLGSVAHPHVLQKAFVEEQAAQCGFCMNGIIMNAKVLLDKNPNPSVAEIKQALANVLCRCGSHLRVIRAIQRAAREKA